MTKLERMRPLLAKKGHGDDEIEKMHRGHGPSRSCRR